LNQMTDKRGVKPGSRVQPLEARREPSGFGPFHRGAHAPVAIRWFGMTALVGHLKHLVAVAAASNDLDSRDWMRPEEAASLLNRVGQVLGASTSGGSLTERLGREVWIDFVADTGDDYDVSLAVARMIFAEYAFSGDEPRHLPRGDLLVFGGDVAYPDSSVGEIQRRLLHPWNTALHDTVEEGRSRVLLGIPGNHDWYDGLDGFGRLFRRNPLGNLDEPATGNGSSIKASGDSYSGRAEGTLQRLLHVDELSESLHLIEEVAESVAAFLLQSTVKRAGRLTLEGYTAVQEASYWAMALAPGLDLWGVDRQLRTADFRQRVFFAQRRDEAQPHKLIFVAPDPALAYDEPNEPGAKLLEACHFSLDSDKLLYLTGDAHHYERLTVGRSMHVISGGGGAFVHGTRIPMYSSGPPPQCVYPDRKASLQLALGMPLRLTAGTAGFLPHGLFALLAAIELYALRQGPIWGSVAATAICLFATVALSFAVRARLERPAATWAIASLFGLILGLAPFGLRFILSRASPWFGDYWVDFWVVVLVSGFIGTLALGVFLLVLMLTGLEHQQGFAALGHPGFRHFVRLCVHPGGKIEGFVIGKDDPVGEGPPVLIDRFSWD
jgi:Calcineurin-like phosphoesterase